MVGSRRRLKARSGSMIEKHSKKRKMPPCNYAKRSGVTRLRVFHLTSSRPMVVLCGLMDLGNSVVWSMICRTGVEAVPKLARLQTGTYVNASLKKHLG